MTSYPRRCKFSVWVTTCAVAVVLAMPWLARAAEAVEFDIAAQPLVPALKAFAEQTGMQLLYKQEAVEKGTSSAVVGRFEKRSALERLLRGTGLEVVFSEENAATIRERGLGNEAAEDTRMRTAEEGKANVEERQAGVMEGDVELDEIVVTAQKREERLKDVPISIVALSADELKKRQITHIDDLPSAVPGLAIQSSGSYARRVQLRGISNGFGSASAVGIYLDEADVTTGLSTVLDLNSYDLERVEVLRGPQGTLYGEGSAGGTIRFITRNPNLHAFSLGTDLAAMFTQNGEPGQRIESVVNIPIINDALGFRVSGIYDHEGGWIDQPAANRKDINGQNLKDVRIKGLWEPIKRLSVTALAEVHRNNGSNNTGEDANGNYTQVFGLTTSSSTQDDFDLYNLTLNYDAGAVRILNAASYLSQNRDTRNFGLLFPVSSPPVPALNDLLSPLIQTADSWMDEFRVSSAGSGAWQWTLGGFYRNSRSGTDLTLYLAPPGPLPGPIVIPPSRFASKSWSVFANTSIKLVDRITVGAGIRSFQDDQQAKSTNQAETFTSTDPRVYAQYQLTEDANIYASAAKGFRTGGFNSVGRPPFSPESVWTYEFGTKMSLLNGHLSTDVDVFYSDYTDYQVFGVPPPPLPPLNITSNGGDARIKGIEWDFVLQQPDQWRLSFNGNWLDTQFTEINASATAYAVGDPLDLVPKYQLSISGERNFNWSGKRGLVRLDYSQQGRETYRNRSIGSFFYSESDIINRLNLNMSVDWSRALRLGLFAQNLTNERGYLDAFGIQNFAARPRPRTYGIEFGLTFD